MTVHWYPDTDLDTPDSLETWAHPLEPASYIFVAIDSQACGLHVDTAWVHVHVQTWFGCSLSVGAGDDDTICIGSGAYITAISTGGVGDVSYHWTPEYGLADPYSASTFASPDSTTLYTVTAIDDSSCVDNANIEIYVKRIDIASLPALDICAGDTVELPLSMSFGAEPIGWQWSPGAFLGDPFSSAPLCFADTSITYTVSALDADGCADTVYIAVSVDSVRTGMSVALSPDTSIAFGGTAHLRAEISGVSGDFGFEWSPSAWLDDPHSLTPNATPPGGTVYRFIAADSQACGVYLVVDSIVVDILPSFECSLSITPEFSETTICRGGSIALETSVEHAIGLPVYSWHPIDYLDDPALPNPIATGIDSTIEYTVVVEDDSCSDTASVIVNVTRVNILCDSVIEICRGDTILLNSAVEHGVEPIAYNWSPDINLEHCDSHSTLAWPDNSIIYTIVALDAVGCPDSATVHIIVDTILTGMEISAIAFPEVIAPGDSVLLTVLVSGYTGEVALNWSGPGTIADPGATITWAFPPDSCWFVVTVGDSQRCGVYSVSESVFVQVVQNPCSIRVEAWESDTICRGESVVLNAAAEFANGHVDWVWRPSAGLDDSTYQYPNATPEMTTHYWAVATDSTGCVDSARVIIAVLETPVAVALADNDTLWRGENLVLSGFPADSSLSYEWSGPAGFFSNERLTQIEDVDTANAGWFVLTVMNENGCSALDSVYIVVRILPILPDIEVSPLSLTFDLYGDGDTTQTQFIKIENVGDTTLSVLGSMLTVGSSGFAIFPDTSLILLPDEIESVAVTFAETIPGNYRDTLRIESTDPDESVVRAPLLGRVHIPPDPAISAYPDIVDFGTVILDSCAADSVNIVNSGGGILIVFEVTPDIPQVRFLRPPMPDSLSSGESRYYVFEFCPASVGSLHAWIRAEVNVAPDSTFLLLALGLGVRFSDFSVNTEVITPNSDGLNDILRFNIPDGIVDWTVEIYNSGGKPVVSGRFLDWDARKDGSVVPIGTYYFRLSSGGETKLSGAISVIY